MPPLIRGWEEFPICPKCHQILDEVWRLIENAKQVVQGKCAMAVCPNCSAKVDVTVEILTIVYKCEVSDG